MDWSLYDARGRRKHLTTAERRRVLRAMLESEGSTSTFCAVMILTGARISEVLALTPERIDGDHSAINFHTLKQGERVRTRAVPVPRGLISRLQDVHCFREAQIDPLKSGTPLWAWSRTTAWRRVKTVMRLARIPPYLAHPHILRHTLATEAYDRDVPLETIQSLLGHVDIRTTEIYTHMLTRRLRRLTARTWLPITDVLSEML